MLALLLGMQLFISVPGSAHADRLSRFNYDKYVGAGLWNVSYAPDSGPDFSMAGAMLKAGYELSPSLSIEAHVGATGSDDQTFFGGATDVSLQVTVLGGVFGKLSWLYEQDRGWARIYALIGFSAVTVDADAPGRSESDSDSSASFGVGVDLFGSDRTAITLEWVRYINQSDFTIDAPIIGIVRRF